jgi:hypothetical protein
MKFAEHTDAYSAKPMIGSRRIEHLGVDARKWFYPVVYDFIKNFFDGRNTAFSAKTWRKRRENSSL